MGRSPIKVTFKLPKLYVLVASAVVVTLVGVLLMGAGVKQATNSIIDAQNKRSVHLDTQTDHQDDKKSFLGICLSVKDDGRWLREWIEFHKLVGIEKIFIIDDNSTDETLSIIKSYSEKNNNFIQLIPGSVPEGDSRCQKPTARDSAYISKCIEFARHKLDWLVLVDSDEYIFPRQGCSLSQHIRQCNQKSTHFLLDWEMFGSNHFLLHPPGLLTENFLLSGGDCSQYVDIWGVSCQPFNGHCKECRHTKYIANMNCMPSNEHCANHFPSRLELTLGNCSSPQSESDVNDDCKLWFYHNKDIADPKKCCKAGIALQHYAPKSQEARRWRSVRKMRNGLHNDRNQTPQMDKRDLNWVYSPGILKYAKRLRNALRKTDAGSVSQLTNVETISISNQTNFDCFTERSFRYTPRSGTAVVDISDFISSAAVCCSLCYHNSTCRAFTYRPSHDMCSLFVSSSHSWPPHSIPLDRKSVDGYISGTPIRDSC